MSLPEEDRERAEPVAGRREHDMSRTRRCKRARDACPFLGRGRGKAGTQVSTPSVRADLPAGLGVDEPQHAGVGQLLLTRVADLDRDDLVPAREIEQRATPI